MDAINLDVATETVDPVLPFYKDESANLIASARGSDVRYIGEVGALGYYPPTPPSVGCDTVLT